MLIQSNALHLPIASETVQCVVTSPPYWGLRDYGITGQLGLEKTPEEYVANMVAVFWEVWRVLKPDGTIWVNLGDSYAGGPSHSGDGMAALGAQYRGGGHKASSIDKPNRRRPDGLKPKDLVGIPWRVAFALQADGWYLRSDIIWSKLNPMPESVTDRPTKAHEYLFLLAKRERYYYDANAIAEPAETAGHIYGFTSVQADAIGRVPTGNQKPENYRKIRGDTRNRRTVWTIPTQPWSGAHFATFPEKLVEPCILAGSRPGDLVLDPFVGSGTVLRVATKFQRRGVGCDISLDYLAKQAKKRAKNVQVVMQFNASNHTGDSALSGVSEQG